MRLFESMKKSALKTKVLGEIAMLDRQLEATQRKFGHELFQALLEWEDHVKLNINGKRRPYPGFGDDAEQQRILSAIFRPLKEQVIKFLDIKKGLTEKWHDMEAYGTTSILSGTNFQMQMLYYDRKIHHCKDTFGVHLFAELDLIQRGRMDVVDSDWNVDLTALTEEDDHLEKLHDAPVLDTLERLRAAVKDIQQQRMAKEREITDIDNNQRNKTHTKISSNSQSTKQRAAYRQQRRSSAGDHGRQPSQRSIYLQQNESPSAMDLHKNHLAEADIKPRHPPARGIT